MFRIVFCCCLLLAQLTFAQDKEGAQSPKNSSFASVKTAFGAVTHFGDYALLFRNVSEDSRCPSDVTCFWAGQITVGIDLFKDGKLLENKTVVFPNTKEESVLLDNDKFMIFAAGVYPYPSIGNGQIKHEHYALQLGVNYK